MDTVLGLPISTLLNSLGIVFSLCALLLVPAALKNRVLFKMGVRSITRRPAQTGLIVLGLMLATLLISSALVTGDTMNYSVKNAALENLGRADVTVELENNGKNTVSGQSAADAPVYIDKALYAKIKSRTSGSKEIDGIEAVVRQQIPAAAPKSHRNLPSLSVLGVGPDFTRSFGSLKTAAGSALRPGNLDAGEVYINRSTAEKLAVAKGDKIEAFTGYKPTALRVAGIFSEGGKPSTGPAMIMPLARAQKLFGMKDKFNAVLISGEGDALEGAKRTAAIEDLVKPALADTHFETKPVKQDALKDAKTSADTFTSIFMIFGQFSMAAGVMLIFLIFVMLAAERRIELGVMRAVGAQRRDILKVFIFEGVVYAALASALGALLGIGVGWLMVKVLSSAFGSGGPVNNLAIKFHFEATSLVIAYAMGLIATFAIVVMSAWKAGRVNIVLAIRDLPESARSKRSLVRLILLGLTLALGVLSLMGGFQSESKAQVLLGVSMVIVALPLIARRFGLSDRAAFTAAGLGLLVLWLSPDDISNRVVNMAHFKSGIEMFFLSGMALVTGAVWVTMHNSDLLLSAVKTVFGRLRGLPPILTVSVNYPMKNGFRTGLALAMFSLVVFTIVFMSVLLGSMDPFFNNTKTFAGGYDIRGTTGYANPVADAAKTIEKKGKGVDAAEIEAIGGLSIFPADIKQEAGRKKSWTKLYLTGFDKGYADSVTYELPYIAKGYKSEREVWQAVEKNPKLAIISGTMVSAKNNYNVGGPKPDFTVSGFVKEDKSLPEIYIRVKSAITGKSTKLRVVGVTNDMAVYTGGVIVGQRAIDRLSLGSVKPNSFFFKVKPGADAERVSEGLAKTFYKNGMATEETAVEIGKEMRASKMMNRLMQGFMALGLIVGIAGLGVIAARSVVERRRHIGMMRAIGFRRGMVQGAFLLETSFVAFLGIAIGSALALLLSRNAINTMARDVPGMVYTIPWVEVGLIAGLAYIASLLTTYLPARQAAKVYPAEALRYE